MAKNATSTEGLKIAPPAVAGGSDSRSVMIDVPMQDGSTRKMSRTEYCQARFAEGAERGLIRKELEQITGAAVTYQTVYQATSEKKKKAAEIPAAAPASGDGSAVA